MASGLEQVRPRCPKALMRADTWRPERWLPAGAQPSGAEVTLAQLRLPGVTVEDAERESPRLRCERTAGTSGASPRPG
ncbi:cytochrome P450 [Streptomyces sp. XM83C]|uniref:cytochrome P450 n=1 Tax=Streptomyces sp. XM83C TaxID=2929781 RepID=UPI001FFA5348|nr:cytochrome P450 [Streptomyces sp. XM83C]MCK1819421.1 cytochrome P450 [Streptomyces sp. XM83C]